VILALNATIDGQTTAHYISDQLGKRVKITSLAQGVPIGGELDYLDDGTYKQYSLTDRLEAFVTYLELTEKYNIRFANIKQQAIRFTKGTVGGGQLRNRLSAAKTTDDLKELLLQKVTV
jgi:tRNA-dihydrouridine synthase